MKQKILVVDDSEESRYLVQCILTDYSVFTAESGSAMWKILEREVPDLILLDVMMPGEDGFEIARSLTADIRFRDIPVIFLTARDSGKDVEQGFSSGGEDYIKKPIEEAEFRARIKSVITKKYSTHALRERIKNIERDLEIAHQAQKTIIRGKVPKCDRLVIKFLYKPMERVGGDYYSFFSGGDESLGFFIGDIAGHGLASALFITLLQSSTDRMFRKYGNEPGMFLKNLNNEIIDYMAKYFVTGIYGLFDFTSVQGDVLLKLSNGGHTMPVIVRHDGAAAFTGASGNILGIKDTFDYTVTEEKLTRGNRFFVFTDGIPETMNEKKEMIGFDDDLLDLFNRSQRESLSDTLDAVIDETCCFRGNQPVQDDITLIGFEVR